MSIYSTWLSIEHPDGWLCEVSDEGVTASRMGDDRIECELGAPWIYQGADHPPSRSDRRGGSVNVAGIDSGPGRHDWLRLSVDSEPSDTVREGRPYIAGGRAVVVHDRAQVKALRDTLTAWLERSADAREGS